MTHGPVTHRPAAATGVVVAGHGVASGRSTSSPFPAGTIAMQAPLLAEHGVDLHGYHLATINLDVAPHRLVLDEPRWTVRDLEWTDVHPAETFSFVECTVGRETLSAGQNPPAGEAQDGGGPEGQQHTGLIYHPHPETKPAHHQPGTVIELLLPLLPALATGERLRVTLATGQAWYERAPFDGAAAG